MFKRYVVLSLLTLTGYSVADASAGNWFRRRCVCQPEVVVECCPQALPCPPGTIVVQENNGLSTTLNSNEADKTDANKAAVAEPTAEEMKWYDELKKDNQFNGEGGKQMSPADSLNFWKNSTTVERKNYYQAATKSAAPKVAAPTPEEMKWYEALKKDNQFNTEDGKQMSAEDSLNYWKSITPEERKKYYEDSKK